MKTKKLWGILMLFLCTLNLTGCNNEDEEGRQITDYKEYLLTVASQQIPGVGWSDGFNYLTDVYAVKKEQSAEWESLSSIKGFEYEEGYEYENDLKKSQSRRCGRAVRGQKKVSIQNC